MVSHGLGGPRPLRLLLLLLLLRGDELFLGMRIGLGICFSDDAGVTSEEEAVVLWYEDKLGDV